MENETGILIFSRRRREKEILSNLLKSEGNAVFETPNALHALSILQKEDIGVIVADRDMEGIGISEFNSLIEKIKPGVTMLFIGQCPEQTDGELTIEVHEFIKLIREQVKSVDLMRKKVDELKLFSFSIVDRLIQIFEVNDRYFFNNDHLVAELSCKMARKMGLKETDIEAIQMAALLRDIGKVGIHNDILSMAKRLNQHELEPVKEHPRHTMQLLKQVKFPWDLDSIVSQHHEHYDGTGYPLGIKGRQISIGARIIAIAETYHAMLVDRPYRKARSREIVIQEIKRNAGTQFDPEVVEIFLSIVGSERPQGQEKIPVLILERESNIAALIKLCTSADSMEVAHSQSSIEAIALIRIKKPRLIIADVSALTEKAFTEFYEAARRIEYAGNRSFFLIVPDKDYPRRFKGDVDYIEKPINLDEMRSLIETRLLGYATPFRGDDIRGLTGRIEDFNLVDLIQILSLGVKTARADITGERGKGIIYVQNGKVVHASLGELKGAEAFTELAAWEKGTFCLLHGETTEEINIKADTMHLLLEATTYIDKRKAFSEPAIENPNAISYSYQGLTEL